MKAKIFCKTIGVLFYKAFKQFAIDIIRSVDIYEWFIAQLIGSDVIQCCKVFNENSVISIKLTETYEKYWSVWMRKHFSLLSIFFHIICNKVDGEKYIYFVLF